MKKVGIKVDNIEVNIMLNDSYWNEYKDKEQAYLHSNNGELVLKDCKMDEGLER